MKKEESHIIEINKGTNPQLRLTPTAFGGGPIDSKDTNQFPSTISNYQLIK